MSFIKCNVRWDQWDGKSTSISNFLTTVLFILFTGMQFALMQVKSGLCHILSRFQVAPGKHSPVSVTFNTKSFLLQMNGDIRLSFNRMKSWNNMYMCAQYVFNIDKNNYLIIPLDKSLLEMTVSFSASRKLQCILQAQYLLVTWTNLMTYKQNFRN
jgi:hypothetical protein